ncbi:MAG: arsenate reductase ArsC [Chloroflexi bacterium]|uniref:Arsenate reductase ArsC n=1 Tax=Candidatus Chlorohelix allophototropha TaxID=3003348 RepID=A0A8T7MA48_9CHLR|nr:arsenate reductase ArsC [Chloroflexota bacterium]WJW68795.1 arsenate reductase ArsC [Chloroflexota bacterium L227-S17]
MTNENKIRVLFLCTHNQARSQMAEGILRHLGKARYEVYSAGNELASDVHPLAIKTLANMGIDISNHYPKHLNQFLDQEFDYIITTCDRIKESCPAFPGDPERIHWSLSDPASVEGSEEEKQAVFNDLAVELGTRIRMLMQLHRFK